MITDTVTKLSLPEWARIFGINPLHFAGVQIPEIQNAFCSSAWPRYNWQAHDRVGREEVADAIAQAEADIENLLRTRLMPTWEVEEWQETIRPYGKPFVNLNAHDVRGYAAAVPLTWANFISGGVMGKTLISAAAPIVYSSTAAPTTWEDTATVTVAVADDAVSACEIAAYYPGHDGDEKYRIRPVSVALAGGVATITFGRELAVLESVDGTLDVSNFRPADGSDNAAFLATVDVYRRWIDPSTQVTLQWEPVGGCSCSGSTTCGACALSVQTGCLIPRGDVKFSMASYRPATWNATTEQFDAQALAVGRAPDSVRAFYVAGLRDRTAVCSFNVMRADWAKAVAYLSATYLDRPPCGCAQNLWDRWARDLSFVSGASEFASYSLSPSDLGNIIGRQAGAVYAWDMIRRSRDGRIGQSAVQV